MRERIPSLYDLSTAELEARLEAAGEPRYRARQIRRWAYRELVRGYDDMTDLPAALRARLARDLPLGGVSEISFVRSGDGLTRKSLLRLGDGELVEAVLMLYDPRSDSRGRATACLSTQAGCAMGCVFCATGQAGFRRNLTAGEITAQAVALARRLRHDEGRRLTNVVFMGMGEPLANYDETLKAIRTLNAADGFGIAARHITISTVGMAPGIRKLARERLQIGLAISLHAPADALRQRLIPTQRRPLSELLAAAREYVAVTGRRVTFEYVVLAGVNDSVEDARRLGRLLRGLLCHVNLIPVNPTAEGAFGRPTRSRVLAFQRTVEALGVPCTVRVEKGVEIAAACGQLRGEAVAPGDVTPRKGSAAAAGTRRR